MAIEGTKAALVRVGLEIVEEHGVDALTLREIGTRAGVSRQTPYRHFENKEVLLAAIASEGMRRERAWMTSALERRGGSPESRLNAIAEAHLRLLTRHRFLYELAYGGAVAKSATPELQQEAIATFSLLREAVHACFPGLTDVAVLRLRCIVLWGTVRGIAELEMRAQVPGSVGGSVNEWVGEAVSTLLAGWKKESRAPTKERKR